MILNKVLNKVDDFTGMIYGHYHLHSRLIPQLAHDFIKRQRYE